MFKRLTTNVFHALLLGGISFLVLQIPQMIYSYELVLTSKHAAYGEDYTFFVNEAQRYQQTLPEYYVAFSQQGERAERFMEHKIPQMETFIVMEKQKQILEKKVLHESILVLFSPNLDVMRIAQHKFEFGLPISLPLNWWYTIVATIFIIYGLFLIVVSLIKKVLLTKKNELPLIV